MERRWTIHFLPRNRTTENFRFVLRFPKNILHIHNSFVSTIALAFTRNFCCVAQPSGRLSRGRPSAHRRGQDALATAGKMPRYN